MASDSAATFGDLLRRARRTVNLSQEELADRSGLSVRGISDLERGVNRTPRKDTLDMLASALGLSANQRREWEHARRQFASPSTSAPAVERSDALNRPTAELPTRLTTFVGREREITDLRALLGRPDIRLVTVTGPGGIGKTSLAVQVAADAAATFQDSVRFVSLAPVRDPDLVTTAIATALGLQDRGARGPQEMLTTYLTNKQALLVLDNYEQVIDAAPLVDELLQACPALTVLVTSRISLRLAGEQEFPIAPLGMPPAGQRQALEQLTEHEAVALFVHRARQHRPDFKLTIENAEAVVDICRQLDGMPLAIELAASRIKLLTPPALLARLGLRLPLLTGGPRNVPVRQQTMRDTIAWSYELLTGDQQRLFRQLSVFAGGWTLEAAEGICHTDPSHDEEQAQNVINGLSALIDQSLVQRVEQADGSTRFTMLETVREFGQERLAQHHELDVLCERHAAYFLAMAATAAPHFDGSGPVPFLNQLAGDHDNLRATLQRLYTTGDAERGLSMVGYLREFWYMRGHLSEGRRQAALFLDLAGAALPTAYRAMALTTAAWLELWQGDAAAIIHAEEALAIWNAARDEKHAPLLLLILGLAADAFHNDLDRATSLYEQTLAIARAVGDTMNIARALSNLGHLAIRQGDLDRATALIEESMTVSGDAGNMQAFSLAMGNLAWVARERNDINRSAELLQERLRVVMNLDDKWSIMRTMLFLAVIAVERKQPASAIQMFAAVSSLRETTGIVAASIDPPFLEKAHAALVEMLGEGAFRAAWEQARALPVDEVIREALETALSMSTAPEFSAPDRLTAREVEVLRMIATGGSNREIADALFLSPRTVERHIANIYLKIDVHSKAEATAYARRQQLA